MPEISRFYGIIIRMYYDDHFPPHFHVEFNEFKVRIRIDNFSLLEGILPQTVLGRIIEWASLHQLELFENWELLRQCVPRKKIEPLK